MILPLLNVSNAPLAPSKRKAVATCTVSLASVSLSGTQHSLSVIPFPTQPSSLCRKRSLARLAQPLPPFSEPERVSPPPPRKRARTTTLSFQPPAPATPSYRHHSLALSQRKPKASRKAVADLRFLCTVYRSLAWMRAVRGHSNTADAMDIDITATSALEAQESVFASRLRSYLIFNEMNPQCLDLVSVPGPFGAEADMDASSSGPSSISSPFQPPWPTMTPEQLTASLLFRFRHRSKGKSRPEAALGKNKVLPFKKRKPSPLAGARGSIAHV